MVATGPMKHRQILKQEELDEDVWTLAVKRARRLYEMFDTPVVSFSGGKDSTATLHAMLAAAHEKPEERLPLRVIFFDEECIPTETVEYVRRVAQRPDVALEWYCVPIACGNACSPAHPFWYPWAPEERDKWVREMPPEARTDFPVHYPGINDPSKRLAHYDCSNYLYDPATEGEVVQVLGIRAAESLRRTQAVSRREKDNWIIEQHGFKNGSMWKAYPIYDWHDDDVWTAPHDFDWDYNRAYDNLEMLGVPPQKQRMGPPFGNEPLEGLWQWKECYPEIWDGMCNRVPGASTAARYSTTELYSYRARPQKPEGLTWPEFIKTLLDRHAPITRGPTAKKIVGMINYHKSRTTDLIPETVAHPETGASWDFIALIAHRGDRMNRKDMTFRMISDRNSDQYKKRLEKAHAEINQARTEGRIKELIA